MVLFNAGDDDTPDRNDIPAVTLGEDPGIPVVNVSYADGEALGTPAALATVHLETDTQRGGGLDVQRHRRDARAATPTAPSWSGRTWTRSPRARASTTTARARRSTSSWRCRWPSSASSPKNKVRFAFFGAEEAGLLGSYHYVEQLSLEDAQKIAAMLDFDMLALAELRPLRLRRRRARRSSDGVGPAGSGEIEKAFNDEFASHGLATEPIPFDGRSDYDGFTAVGIPAGGIFAGAEDVKTQEEVDLFGGIPDLEFDPNYHESGDTIRNINRQGYAEHAAAASYVSAQYAFDKDLAAPTIEARAARRSAHARGRATTAARRRSAELASDAVLEGALDGALEGVEAVQRDRLGGLEAPVARGG